ncbi:DUF2637 domain-containing protein [Micromonospora chersina]|uniref:DUF2637 domain-containing protein n=1 Tax=Micromonospora chersina TaxID=47854 RepID=UPI00371428CC
MTAPTINGTRYPQPVDELVPVARKLADELGEVPSRNRLMREFRIGAPKAEELRALLLDEPPADPWDYAEPIGPDPAPEVEPDPVPAKRTRRRGRVQAWFRRRRDRKPSPQVAAVSHPGTVSQLKRVRWGVRLVLTLGVAASIAGNVLHARDEVISQIISAWSPLALLLTVELISRVPVHRPTLAVGRWIATAVIAGIAAWVSYWHMAAVASRYGETNGSQYLLPLSVDGLVVVASICLVELGGRIASANGGRRG